MAVREMPGRLQALNFHARAPGLYSVSSASQFRSLNAVAGAPPGLASFQSDEAAARHYLDSILRQDDRSGLRSLVAADVPGVVPSLQLSQTRIQRINDHRQLTFVQTAAPSVRVFGSSITVELNGERDLVSITATLAEAPTLYTLPSLTPQQALDAIKKFTGAAKSFSEVKTPELWAYKDDNETWRLVYQFRNVPAAPPEAEAELAGKRSSGHGLDLSPRDLEPDFDYLVDAHTADIVFYYSASPAFAGIPGPTLCSGDGEDGNVHKFFGRKSATGAFEMADTMRSIKTFDLNFGDLATTQLPLTNPISNPSSNWGVSAKSAVSAHVNLEQIFDFYNSVLFRDSIDDKRMEIIGLVNCCYSGNGPGRDWHNAVWWRDHMWFGQRSVTGGQFESFSKYLDVIAHELTHGVTQYTCGLVYRDQSGALNESISDIFGMIISNYYQVSDTSTQNWKWQLGPGLASNGGPLRNFSDPTKTNDPDHMRNYFVTTRDNGGVHTNSNIHNKAAYNMLTATDASGASEFSPKDVALFYYLALTRLGALAGFADMKQSLLDVINSYYLGSPAVAQAKVAAVDAAYAAVGL
jgi:Zn-dependent metalloprotease